MKQKQSFIILITVLQCAIKYLDECLGLTIGKEPIFKMDLKMAAKTLLEKLEKWLYTYYKKNGSDISELNDQVTSFTDIFENSAKIAFQLSQKEPKDGYAFQKEFDELIKKYGIVI
jgi:hypothetical protein